MTKKEHFQKIAVHVIKEDFISKKSNPFDNYKKLVRERKFKRIPSTSVGSAGIQKYLVRPKSKKDD